MSLNETPSSERIHIGFFGLRNAGKSSLVNALTNQNMSVVSDVPGTTTDPVRKAMELLPLGPVVIIDTPGFDDIGELGNLRVEKTREILRKCDIAVLVTDAAAGTITEKEGELLSLIREQRIPCLIVRNKADLSDARADSDALFTSAKTGLGVDELKNRLAELGGIIIREKNGAPLVRDLVKPGDTVILVIPLDEAAPKGRIILPQQMVIRELLDAGCLPLCCRPAELPDALRKLNDPPALVVTDSQAFGEVAALLPESAPLTSFSILMARYKGDLDQLMKGCDRLKTLKNGDRVLIAEGCTHHRQCGDIGSEKIPAWIKELTGAEPTFTFSSGGGFPDISAEDAPDLIIHCGGCMLNEKEMKHRLSLAEEAGVPIVNYGMAIALLHGVLARAVSVLPPSHFAVRSSE